MMQHHPMKDGGFVSTHEDITEQRQQEAAGDPQPVQPAPDQRMGGGR